MFLKPIIFPQKVNSSNTGASSVHYFLVVIKNLLLKACICAAVIYLLLHKHFLNDVKLVSYHNTGLIIICAFVELLF